MIKVLHRIVPRSANEARVIKAVELASKILSDQLKLVNLTLQVQRQTGWGGSRAFHAGMYVDSKKLIKINLRNLQGTDIKTIMEVLGHEFRHALQHSKQWLVNRRWNGPEVNHHNMTFRDASFSGRTLAGYWNKPEERDARANEEAYAALVLNHPDFKSFTGLKFDGIKPQRPDYEKSYEAIGYTLEDGKKYIQLFRKKDHSLWWMDIRTLNGLSWTKKWQKIAWQNEDKMREFKYVMVDVTKDELFC